MSFLKIIFEIIFYYPATALHELAHAIVGVMVGGRIVEFSLSPSIVDGRLVFGRVVVAHHSEGLFLLPSLAPLLYWIVLWYFATTSGYIFLSNTGKELVVSFSLLYKTDITKLLFDGYIFLQLLSAGVLSREDMRSFTVSLLSIYGILQMFLLLQITYVFFKIYPSPLFF